MPEKKSEEAEKPKEKPAKKKLTQEEYEKKVLALAKTGLTAEKIGEELRNQKIHPKAFKKKISEILGDVYEIPELKNVEAKLKQITAHLEKNKGDKRAMREKDRVSAQLRRIKKYFKKE
jgi:ribosomal protein S15P/S13E